MNQEIETIELWTGEDWVAAEKLTNNTAILKELSVITEYSYNDLVLFNSSDNEIQQVIKRENRTKIITYSTSVFFSKDENKFLSLKKHLENFNLIAQKHEIGVVIVAVPLSITEDELDDIFHKSPVDCTILEQEEIEKDDEEDGLFLKH